MSVPEAKAFMARAYASGKMPKLLSVDPSGTDEVWALDEVAFVLPAVPPDASPLLEYALRLRREATLAGSCDQCGATFRVEAIDEENNTSVGAGIFPHRSNCPAADEYIAPLLEAYSEQHAVNTARNAFTSASRRTKEYLLSTLQNRIDVKLTSKIESKANKLLNEKLEATAGKACGHLRGRPAQTWNLCLWDDTWRCNECALRFSESVRLGAFRLDPIEDHSCDYCRRYCPNTLSPMVMRVGIHVMHGAMCRRCAREWGHSERRTEIVK
jgi:hypothetical protein